MHSLVFAVAEDLGERHRGPDAAPHAAVHLVHARFVRDEPRRLQRAHDAPVALAQARHLRVATLLCVCSQMRDLSHHGEYSTISTRSKAGTQRGTR